MLSSSRKMFTVGVGGSIRLLNYRISFIGYIAVLTNCWYNLYQPHTIANSQHFCTRYIVCVTRYQTDFRVQYSTISISRPHPRLHILDTTLHDCTINVLIGLNQFWLIAIKKCLTHKHSLTNSLTRSLS